MDSKLCYLGLLAMISMTWAYPTSVPGTPEVCTKMTPGHGPSPQKSRAPYSVSSSQTNVKGGGNIEVTLSAIDDQTFKGFYVQARDNNGSPIGTFFAADGVKTHSCGGIKSNAAHHSGKDDKETVSVYWQAPKDYNGQVTFMATFVEEFETFWTNVRSSPVTVSINSTSLTISPSPPPLDKGDKSTAPKNSQEGRILNYNPYAPYRPLTNADFTETSTNVKAFSKRSQNIVKSQDASKDQLRSGSKQVQLQPRTIGPFWDKLNPFVLSNNPQNEPVAFNPFDQNFDISNCEKEHQHKAAPVLGGWGRLPSDHEENLPSYYNPHAFIKNGEKPVEAHQFSEKELAYLQFLRWKSQTNNFIPHNPNLKVPTLTFPQSETGHYGFRPSLFPGPKEPLLGINVQSHHPHPFEKTPQGQIHRVPQSLADQRPINLGLFNSNHILNTGIVLPKGMKSYELPRYGYLIFNPHKGPPYYLIPAEDDARFEELHLKDPFEISPQPVLKRRNDKAAV